MRSRLAGLALMAAFATTLSNAPMNAETTQVRASIPVHCAIEQGSIQVAATIPAAQSTVQEFCNTPRGFEVVASYRPLTTGETATLTYGSDTIELEADGSVAIAVRSSARYASETVSISANGLADTLSVSFEANPL